MFWKRFLNRKFGVHWGVYISALLGRIILVLLPLGQNKRRSCLPHYIVAGLQVQVVIWHCLTTKSAWHQFKATNGHLRGNNITWERKRARHIGSSAPSCGMQFLLDLQSSRPWRSLSATSTRNNHQFKLSNVTILNIHKVQRDNRNWHVFNSFFSDTEQDSVPCKIRISGTS